MTLLLTVTLAIAWTWFPWLFTIRARVREGPGWLKRERARMERVLLRRVGTQDLESAPEWAAARYGQKAADAIAAWIALYRRARFGKPSPQGDPRATYQDALRGGRRAVEDASSRAA